ncbi:MAG TPA: beta-ketoacyl-[acyl-carrier-protein] synthase family protein [Steroidobacteraceae bacterium]|jgi:3-oxoacyl-[acyl-carrier-protein] synthase II|nr:beta-ketoacyl-[acyl-carrier-protein] synthase family protein [Steroidobacteraceae bacterium]
MKERRVAITGLGVMVPIGRSIAELTDNLAQGRSGVRRLEASLCGKLRVSIGAAVDFDAAAAFEPPRLRLLDRVSQLALIAAAQALQNARLRIDSERRERCGVFVGCALGGAQSTDAGYRTIYGEASDRVNPYTVLAAMTTAPASWISIEHGLFGPSLTYSTACSSSAVAIGEAARRIRSGEVDVMLAGGAEAPLTFGVLSAWDAMRTLATEDAHDPGASCRPFSRNRTGLVLGEGAAFVVLEDWEHAARRGAHVHAELTGYGLTSDASHITRPSLAGQASAMRAALAEAGPAAHPIGYINAHGTGTQQNDVTESGAIKEVFADRAYSIPVSSSKAVHGHLLGAAGALEFIIAVICLEKQMIAPTMHLDAPDPDCDLDYVAEGARYGVGLEAVMSNSFAFGGTNAVLIAETAVS